MIPNDDVDQLRGAALLTAQEAAALTHVSPQTVRRWVRDGMPATMHGGRLHVYGVDVLAHLGYAPPPAEAASAGEIPGQLRLIRGA